MKTLKRVKLNQLNGIQDISMDEMMQILGGKGCCWEVLAKLYKETHSEYLRDPELKNSPYFSASSFESMWRTYMGDECAPNGDPMNYQASDLFNFIQELPHLRTTTENGFESNGYGSMMSISGYHNGCNQGRT